MLGGEKYILDSGSNTYRANSHADVHHGTIAILAHTVTVLQPLPPKGTYQASVLRSGIAPLLLALECHAAEALRQVVHALPVIGACIGNTHLYCYFIRVF